MIRIGLELSETSEITGHLVGVVVDTADAFAHLADGAFDAETVGRPNVGVVLHVVLDQPERHRRPQEIGELTARTRL
jgi:hypothetical protein